MTTLATIYLSKHWSLQPLPLKYRLQHAEANAIWRERHTTEQERWEYQQAMRKWAGVDSTHIAPIVRSL